jgi:MFS transporter, DHA1 family, inner membrane transport protein
LSEERSLRYLIASLVIVLQPSLVLYVTPLYLGALARARDLAPEALAIVGSVEAGGAAVAMIVLAMFVRRLDLRVLGVLALAALTIGTLGCLFASRLETLLPLRALVGVGVAFLATASNLYLAATLQPVRWFGWQMTLSTLVTMAAVVALPLLERRFGLNAYYAAALLLTPATLWAILSLPYQARPQTTALNATVLDAADGRAGVAAPSSVSLAAPLLAIVAIMFYAAYVYPTYNFSERIGAAIQLDAVFVGVVLSVTTGIGLMGSLLASAINDRWGILGPVAASAAIAAVGAVTLAVRADALGFWIAMGAMSFVWNFAQPFLYANLASCDRDGRYLFLLGPTQDGTRSVMMLVYGVTLGSAGFSGVLLLGASLMVACVLMLLVARSVLRRRASHSAPVIA